jgi:hypothetical protein
LAQTHFSGREEPQFRNYQSAGSLPQSNLWNGWINLTLATDFFCPHKFLATQPRRCTGSKVTPASLVLRSSVQLIACVATQLTTWYAEQLAAVSVNDWRFSRSQLE